ncbi:YaiI/YqxD family protein [Tepidibacter mesophilus]|uniref:YaiI/YqxD family protein n=1 Tax=Tepidibacter mesophilus TaxID=655607 RepID=UPI000C06D0EB|nr:YaiI/YqxD family protein [Tepidibacter mesophilus]
MRILVDADACPVKDIIIKIAKNFNIAVMMFIDTSHVLHDNYSQIITVGQGKDSVDMALINSVEEGDVIITQDYGLAAMVLAKKAHVINQNGLIYTDDNIDMLLLQRHLSQKARKARKRTRSAKKRTKLDNELFERNFIELCESLI